ncbi:Arm DNA-binding domain-containing protein [Flavobacterium myungsuense]|uniref:Arm DNA-binding domain-containing protein n=1 Tax=Flavobacterium myungsuense TaxID=651823 RepID=UPI003630C00C
MHQEKVSILFLIKGNRVNQRDLCPLLCRITIHKKKQQFSTGLFVNPHYWESKHQKVNTQDFNHKYINAQIERIQVKLYNIILVFQLQGIECSIDNILNEYKGLPLKKKKIFCHITKNICRE